MADTRPKAILIGAKKFNVPKQLPFYFNAIRHYESDTMPKGIPMTGVDIVIAFTDFISHAAIDRVKNALPGVPFVSSPASWSHLKTRLEKMNLLPASVYRDDEIEKHIAPAAAGIAVPSILPELTDAELEKLTAPTPPAPTPAPMPSALAVAEAIIPKEALLFMASCGKIQDELKVLRDRRMEIDLEYQRKLEEVDRQIERKQLELENYGPVLKTLDRLKDAVRQAQEAMQLHESRQRR